MFHVIIIGALKKNNIFISDKKGLIMEKIDSKMIEATSVTNCKWIEINNTFLNGVINSEGFMRLKKEPFISDNVNLLRKHSSGINLVFQTDSSFLSLKAQLAGAAYMPHMTAVATIGFDLYFKAKDKWVFLSTTKVNQANYEVSLYKDFEPKLREYKLYFPLYQEVKSLNLGIMDNAKLKFTKENKEKIVIYGTSISQGGCASRPGLTYGALLGRWLDKDIINLGFSGSAHMEDAITAIINNIPHKWLILELEANNSSTIKNKLEGFLNKIVSEKIILITHFPLAMSLVDKKTDKLIKSNYIYQQSFANRVIVVDGRRALKNYQYEETVDGVHLNDLGFYGLAKYLQKIIKKSK